MSLWPGRRRSRSAWRSATVKGSRGGQPSITTPTAAPWLSPQVVIWKSLPKELGTAQRIKPTPTAGKLLAHIALSDSWCPRPELNRDMTFRKRLLYPFELRGLSWFPDMPWAMDWQIKNAR